MIPGAVKIYQNYMNHSQDVHSVDISYYKRVLLMKIMVSACLTGENCKYNGGNNKNEKVLALLKENEVISICPEVMGGLPTPRVPSEVRNGVVTAKDGTVVDAEFRRGAQLSLELARKEKPDLIILQSRSPSCGVKQRYDGTFTGTLTGFPGVTAGLLIADGFRVMDVSDLMSADMIGVAGSCGQEIIEDAVRYIRELFRDDSGGHDAEHTLRVWHNAQLIAKKTPSCCLQRVSLAALLHDADDHKLFATENNANARSFLEKHAVPADEIEKICEVINAVSFSRNRDRRPDTIEGKIVQDADRLDAMGAVGIARTFAFGGRQGRPPEESVRHFYDKLLLLKDLMNTEAGRELAGRRHDFLELFLKEYDEETRT